jgi:hypothetical protein
LTFCWWCSSMEIIFWQTYCIDVCRDLFYGIYMISACEILSLRILKDMTISLIFSIFCLMDMTNFWINKLFILFVFWKWLFHDFFYVGILVDHGSIGPIWQGSFVFMWVI